MSKRFSKSVAMLLTVVMIIAMIPVAALAAEPTPGIVGYVMKDTDGNLIQIMKKELDDSMAAFEFNPNTAAASLYKYFRSLMADEDNPVAYLYAQLDAQNKIIQNTVKFMEPSKVTSAIMTALTTPQTPGEPPVDLSKAVSEAISDTAVKEPPSTVVNGGTIYAPPALDADGVPEEDVKTTPPVVEVGENGEVEVKDPGVDPTEPTEGKLALEAAMELVAALEEADYTAASWAELETALAIEAETDAEMLTKAAAIMAALELLVESEEPGDNTALLSAIEDAQALSDSVIEGESDETVPEGQKWASKAAIDAYAAAISVAEAVAENEEATQKAIDAALAALNTATTAFQGEISEGTAAWTIEDYITAIEATISSAEKLLGMIIPSADGEDVDEGKYWATTEDISAFESAIATAQAYIDGEEYDLEGIAGVLEVLNTAYGAFKYNEGTNPVASIEDLFDTAETAVDALKAYTENDLENWDSEIRDEAFTALTAAKLAVAALKAHANYDAETHALENEALIETLEGMISEYDDKEPVLTPEEAADAACEALTAITAVTEENYEAAQEALEVAIAALAAVEEIEEYDSEPLAEAIANLKAEIEKYEESVEQAIEAEAAKFEADYATILVLKTTASVEALTHKANWAIVALFEGSAEAAPAVPSFAEAYAALSEAAAALVDADYPAETGEGKFADIDALVAALEVKIVDMKAKKAEDEFNAAKAALTKAMTTPNKTNLDAATKPGEKDSFIANQSFLTPYKSAIDAKLKEETSALAIFKAAEATAAKATAEQYAAAIDLLKALITEVNTSSTFMADKAKLDTALAEGTMTYAALNAATGAKAGDAFMAVEANVTSYKTAIKALEDGAIFDYITAQAEAEEADKATGEQYNAALAQLKEILAEVNYTETLANFLKDYEAILKLLTGTVSEYVDAGTNSTTITNFLNAVDSTKNGTYVGEEIIDAVDGIETFFIKESLYDIATLASALKNQIAAKDAKAEVIDKNVADLAVDNLAEPTPYTKKIEAVKTALEKAINNPNVTVVVTTSNGSAFKVVLSVGTANTDVYATRTVATLNATFATQDSLDTATANTFNNDFSLVLALKKQSEVNALTLPAKKDLVDLYTGTSDESEKQAEPGFEESYNNLSAGAKAIVDTAYKTEQDGFANISALIAAMNIKVPELKGFENAAASFASTLKASVTEPGSKITASGNEVKVTDDITLKGNVTVPKDVILILDSSKKAVQLSPAGFTLTIAPGGAAQMGEIRLAPTAGTVTYKKVSDVNTFNFTAVEGKATVSGLFGGIEKPGKYWSYDTLDLTLKTFTGSFEVIAKKAEHLKITSGTIETTLLKNIVIAGWQFGCEGSDVTVAKNAKFVVSKGAAADEILITASGLNVSMGEEAKDLVKIFDDATLKVTLDKGYKITLIDLTEGVMDISFLAEVLKGLVGESDSGAGSYTALSMPSLLGISFRISNQGALRTGMWEEYLVAPASYMETDAEGNGKVEYQEGTVMYVLGGAATDSVTISLDLGVTDGAGAENNIALLVEPPKLLYTVRGKVSIGNVDITDEESDITGTGVIVGQIYGMDVLVVDTGATLTVGAGRTLVINEGAALDIKGTLNVDAKESGKAGGTLILAGDGTVSGTLNIFSGGTLNVDSDAATLTFAATGTVNLANGAILTCPSKEKTSATIGTDTITFTDGIKKLENTKAAITIKGGTAAAASDTTLTLKAETYGVVLAKVGNGETTYTVTFSVPKAEPAG